MQYQAAVFSRISVSCWSSSSLPPNRSMSSANRRPVVIRLTLTTVECQFLLNLLLHHLQSNRFPMDVEVSKSSALSFPGIY